MLIVYLTYNKVIEIDGGIKIIPIDNDKGALRLGIEAPKNLKIKQHQQNETEMAQRKSLKRKLNTPIK